MKGTDPAAKKFNDDPRVKTFTGYCFNTYLFIPIPSFHLLYGASTLVQLLAPQIFASHLIHASTRTSTLLIQTFLVH